MLSQRVHDRKFPSSVPCAKPSTAKPRKRTIREQAIDWIRESPPTAQGGLTPAERETLYELTNWFPKAPTDFKVTPHIASRDFPSGCVRGVLDNLGGITRNSFLQRMKSLTDKGYVRKVKHGYGSRSGYTTLTAWELLADPAAHLRKQFPGEMDFRAADAYAHEQGKGANKPSPMSTAEGLNGVHKEDNSLHDSLSRNACMQQSESNEKSDDGRVLKIAQKRQYVPGGCQCNLNDSQHLSITERRVERTIPNVECTIRVEACDNYKRTKWHCSRTRYLDEPPLVGLEDFANHAGGDSPLTGEEKNHVIDAMTVADSKDPIRSPKAFIGGILGNIAIGQEDVGRYARNSNRTNRATSGATRQLLLPVTTIEFAYRYGGLSSTKSIRVRFQVMSPVQEDMIGTDFGTQGVPRRATAFNWNNTLHITAARTTLPAFSFPRRR